MARIEKRGELQWRVQIRRKGFPPQSRTFSYKEDAEKWGREVERELETIGFVDRRMAEGTTFAEVLTRYSEDVTPAKKSAPTEQSLIRGFLRDPELVQVKMSALDSATVAAWRDRRLKVVKPGTVNRELNVISAIINHARREWRIHMMNPVELVKRPASPQGRDRRLSVEEERYLTAELSPAPRKANGTFGAGTRNSYIGRVMLLAVQTAMRRGEILRLRWEHLDLMPGAAFAHLPMTKNGEARDVPLSSKAVEILRTFIEPGADMPTEGQVFRTTDDALKKAFSRAVRRARQRYLDDSQAVGKQPKTGFLENLRFHDTRHEGTSRLAKKLNVLELSATTGHKDMRSLKRYYHPEAAELAGKLD